MNTTHRILTTSALLSGLLSAPAFGSLVFEENFNYNVANGTALNNAAIAPWIGGSGNPQFSTTNTEFNPVSGYANDANANATGGGSAYMGGTTVNQQRAVERTSASMGGIPAINGEFWFSMVHRNGGLTNDNQYSITTLGGAGTRDFSGNSFNNTTAWTDATSFGFVRVGGDVRAYVALGIPGGNQANWNTGRTISSDNLVTNETYLFLIRGNTTTGALDLWLFDEASSVPQTVAGLGTAAISLNSGAFQKMDSLLIGQTGSLNTSATRWDAIRVSDASGDLGLQAVIAIPEPGTLLLLGFAVTFLIHLRRRK